MSEAISLAALEARLWAGGLDVLAESHVHRATCEDSITMAKGRDNLAARWIAAGAGRADHAITPVADLGDMIAIEGGAEGERWQLHRWVWREEGRILREVEISNRSRSLPIAEVHAPLGELRSGEGQFAAAAEPLLPPGFPPAAMLLAQALHRIVNARALDDAEAAPFLPIVADLPDATLLVEHGVAQAEAEGGAAAVLFRLMGHTGEGRRIRLIGSALDHGGRRHCVIDPAAYAAQAAARHISYG